MHIKGIIFDMDGVVTQTAELHYLAWKRVINPFLQTIFPLNTPTFSKFDYLKYLDGVPRKEGFKNYILTCKIDDNKIKKYYKNLKECVDTICERKNNLFLSLISENEIKVFPDTLEFIDKVLTKKFEIALISSSKNCKQILKAAGIPNLFPIAVDGQMTEILKIAGKPEPDIFLEAARQLHLRPEECLVIEDALLGVKAAKSGHFAMVVALDRNNKLKNQFEKYCPDFVLSDLSDKQTNFHQKLFQERASLIPAKESREIIDLLTNNEKELILFLDYDGTLTPIVSKPIDAYLPMRMKETLVHLSKKYTTLIISGRALSDLKNRIQIPDIYYAGNHGFELEGPNRISFKVAEEFSADLEVFFEKIYLKLADLKGCILENKQLSLSIHYRLVEEGRYHSISDIINDLIQNYPNLRRHDGKKVIEIRPHINWNKGIASANFLKLINKNPKTVLPLYIGDDVSDEDAFKQFNSQGITIKVGNDKNSFANYFLTSPMEVREFLNELNEMRRDQ